MKQDSMVRLCLDGRTLNTKLIADVESPEPIDSLLYKFPNPAYNPFVFAVDTKTLVVRAVHLKKLRDSEIRVRTDQVDTYRMRLKPKAEVMGIPIVFAVDTRNWTVTQKYKHALSKNEKLVTSDLLLPNGKLNVPAFLKTFPMYRSPEVMQEEFLESEIEILEMEAALSPIVSPERSTSCREHEEELTEKVDDLFEPIIGTEVLQFVQTHLVVIADVPTVEKFSRKDEQFWQKFFVEYRFLVIRALAIWSSFSHSQHVFRCMCCVRLRQFLPVYNVSIRDYGTAYDYWKQVSHFQFAFAAKAMEDEGVQNILTHCYKEARRLLTEGWKAKSWESINFELDPTAKLVKIDHSHLTPVGSEDTEFHKDNVREPHFGPELEMCYSRTKERVMVSSNPDTGFPYESLETCGLNCFVRRVLKETPTGEINLVWQIVNSKFLTSFDLPNFEDVPLQYQSFTLLICQKLFSGCHVAAGGQSLTEIPYHKRASMYFHYINTIKSTRFKFMYENVRNLRYPHTNIITEGKISQPAQKCQEQWRKKLALFRQHPRIFKKQITVAEKRMKQLKV